MGLLAGLAWGRQVGDWLAEFLNWPAGGGPAGWLAGSLGRFVVGSLGRLVAGSLGGRSSGWAGG